MLIIAIAVLLLCVRVLFVKGGKFHSMHVHDNAYLRKKGIHCVVDRTRRHARPTKPINVAHTLRQQQNKKKDMKNVFSKLAVVAIAATALMSCNNQPKQNDSKAEPATQKEAQAGGQQIAYVEIDSIMSQYTYWKEVTKIMKAKEANISKTLNGKQQQLQQAAANFQQNVQANKYTQAQAQQIQASIQKQAQDAEALQQRLGAEYQNEVAKYNKALADSVHNYLAQFNKDKKYAMILAKSGDNILYADKSLDITNEVVKGMNKAYKGMKK